MRRLRVRVARPERRTRDLYSAGQRKTANSTGIAEPNTEKVVDPLCKTLDHAELPEEAYRPLALWMLGHPEAALGKVPARQSM